MSSAERRLGRGTRNGLRLLRGLGDELREARVAAGLSQATLGAACGLSHTHIGRLERGEVPGASLLVISRIASLLGLRLTGRVFPEGAPLRDAGHAALLERFRRRLPAGVRLRTEVPLAFGDDRAWDATLDGLDVPLRIEAETRLRDLQAVDRRIALKAADDRSSRCVLLLADTRANRLVIRLHGPLLAARYPVAPRELWKTLAARHAPPGNACVLL